MSDTRHRYIAKLQILRQWLWDHVNALEYPSLSKPNRWAGFPACVAVGEAAELARELRLPPAIWLVALSAEEAKSKGIDIAGFPNLTAGGEWRLVRLVARNVRGDKRRSWLLKYEERVGDDEWVARGWLKPGDKDGAAERIKYNHASEMWWFLDEWAKFLSLLPGPLGYVDTPFNGGTWLEHCDYQASAAAAHINGFHNPERKNHLELPADIRRAIEAECREVKERYERAEITAHYAKCAINNYLQRLIKDSIDEPRKVRRMYQEMRTERSGKSRLYAARQLREHDEMVERTRSDDEKWIAESVRHFCRLVIPLDLPDAPEMPLAERMTNTEAIALLDKLKRSCLRRMVAEGDPRATPPLMATIPTVTTPESFASTQALPTVPTTSLALPAPTASADEPEDKQPTERIEPPRTFWHGDRHCELTRPTHLELMAFFIGKDKAPIGDVVRAGGPVVDWRHKYSAQRHRQKVKNALSKLNSVLGTAQPAPIPISFGFVEDYIVKRATD